jgi:hypothetical protein
MAAHEQGDHHLFQHLLLADDHAAHLRHDFRLHLAEAFDARFQNLGFQLCRRVLTCIFILFLSRWRPATCSGRSTATATFAPAGIRGRLQRVDQFVLRLLRLTIQIISARQVEVRLRRIDGRAASTA